jgi:hypothetical protein
MEPDDFTVETTAPEPQQAPDPVAEATPSAEAAAPDAADYDAPEPEPADTPAEDTDPILARNADGTFKSKAKRGSLDELRQKHARSTWEAKETQRQLDAERTERARLAAEVETLRRGHTRQGEAAGEPGSAASSAPSGKPKVEDFGTYEDYTEALTEWKVEQRFQRMDQEAQQRQVAKAWGERFAAAKATIPDLDTVLHNSKDRPISNVMQHVVLSSERGPAILHYLATHPEECDQLAAESAHAGPDAAPWMRRFLEAKLVASGAASSGPAPTASRVLPPPPVKPLGGGPVVAESSPEDEEDVDRYIDRANKKHGWRGVRITAS